MLLQSRLQFLLKSWIFFLTSEWAWSSTVEIHFISSFSIVQLSSLAWTCSFRCSLLLCFASCFSSYRWSLPQPLRWSLTLIFLWSLMEIKSKGNYPHENNLNIPPDYIQLSDQLGLKLFPTSQELKRFLSESETQNTKTIEFHKYLSRSDKEAWKFLWFFSIIKGRLCCKTEKPSLYLFQSSLSFE